MFWIERGCGILIYALCLIIVFSCIQKTNIPIRRILNFYKLILAIMAYSYIPYKTADLYRTGITMTYFSQFSFSDFVEEQLFRNITPLANLLYWGFSKISDVHLLSGCCCFICFSIIFWVLRDYAAQIGASRSNIALCIFFIMSVGIYMPIISGIRMMLALCLLLLAGYRHVNGQLNLLGVVVLSMTAILIHSVAIPLSLILLLSLLIRKRFGVKQMLFIFLVAIVIAALSRRLGALITGSLQEKMVYYFQEDIYTDKWEYLIASITILAQMHFIRHPAKEQDQIAFTFRRVAGLSLLISLVFFWSFTMFHRFALEIGALMCSPVLLSQLESARKKGNPAMFNSTFAYSAILLLLNMTRGSLSALKFFVISG